MYKKILLIYIVFLIVSVTANQSFKYNKDIVGYVVNKPIDNIVPNLNGRGLYSVYPSLVEGLHLDKDTGVISGIPKKSINTNYTITFMSIDNSVKLESVIYFTGMLVDLYFLEWVKPTVVSCGFIKIKVEAKINDDFLCVADQTVSSFSIVNPLEGLSIDNNGNLIFKDYYVKGLQQIIVKAQNQAGDASVTLQVEIPEEPTYINGVAVTITRTSSFTCLDFDINTVEYYDKESGLWNEIKEINLGGAYSNQNLWFMKPTLTWSYEFRYEFEGFINVETEEEYSFYYNLEGRGMLKIDDNEVINLMDQCNEWVENEKDNKEKIYRNTVNLSVGMHKFNVIGFTSGYYDDNTPQLYRMTIKYITTSDATVRSIPLLCVDPTYVPIKELSAAVAVHKFPVGMTGEIKFFYTLGNYYDDHYCNTTTPLPEGYSINVNTNKIEGKTDIPQPLTSYELYCYTANVETNHIVITIGITDQFHKGVIGYYMKPNKFDEYIWSDYDPNEEKQVKVEFIRIDKTCNHEPDTNNTVWEGLTPNFATRYAVRWEGYLKVDKEINGFKLSSIDGSWFYFTEKSNFPLISNSGVHPYDYVVITDNYAPGLYPITVSYVKKNTGSGIKLEVKFAGSEEWVDVKDYLLYVPNSDFEYTYHTATYTTEVDISSNSPMFTDNIIKNKVVKEYTVNKNLPDGLVLNPTTGSITGKPTTVQNKDEYIITVEFQDNTKMNASVFIKVDGDPVPNGYNIIDYNTGEVLGNPVVFYLGEIYDVIGAPMNGYVDKVIFTKYPPQLQIDYYKLHLVSNYPLKETFENEEIEIEVSLPDGSTVTQSFNATGRSKCDGDKKYHKLKRDMVVMENGYFTLTSEDGTVNISDSFNPETPTFQAYYIIDIGCVKPQNFKFSVHDEYGLQYSITWIMITDGKEAAMIRLEDGQTDGVFESVSSIGIPPKIVYPETDIVVSLEDAHIIVAADIGSTPISTCHVDSTSGCQSLSVFNKDCKIDSYMRKEGEKVTCYVIARNDFGETRIPVNITVSKKSVSELCEESDKSLLVLDIHVEKMDNMKVAVYNNDDGKRVVNWSPYDVYLTQVTKKYCLVKGKYKITLTNPIEGTSWDKDYVQVSFYEAPLGKYSLRKGEASKTTVKNLNYIMDGSVEWSYSYQYTQGWNLNNIQDTWQKSKLSKLTVEENKNTIYLRYLKQFGDIKDFASFYVRISHLSGIIFYINGKEFYRQNVVDGELSEDSKAISKFDSLTDIKFVLPIEVLNQTITSISMELHKYDGETSFPEIKFVGLELEGDEEYGCERLNLYADEVTDYSPYNLVNQGGEYGFDLIPNTLWAFTKASYATMNFKKNNHVYFNQLEIQGYGLDGFSQVKEVVLKGKERKSSEYKELDRFTNIEISNVTGSVVYPNYELVSLYESVQIDITKPENEMTAVRDFIFSLCPIKYCSEIVEYNIPKTIGGTTLNVSCLEPVNEYKILYCENGRNPQWQELVNNCIENPKLMDKRDFKFEAGTSYSDISLFTVSGPNIVYSMLEEIKGLKFDIKTGRISGTPLEVVDEKPFYFKAVNNFDTIGITFDVKLSVIEATKPVFLLVNDSISITAGDEIKEMKLFIVLGRELEFTVLNLPIGLSFDKEKRVINGIAQKYGVYNTTFRASNMNNTESVVVVINVFYPNKPLISKIQENIDLFYYENYSAIIPVQCIGRDLKYSTKTKLPTGLGLIESSGELKGTVVAPIGSVFKINIVCSNGNGSASGESTIKIEESNYPILIRYNKVVTIKGGVKDSYRICNVSGTDVTYSLTTSVPDYLTFDKKSGMISGYVLKKYGDSIYTMIISGGGKSIHFDFTLSFIIDDKPVVVDDTIVKNKKFEGGSEIVGFKLFEVVGTNIQITVKPPLPNGVYLNRNSAMIYGIASEIKPPQDYVFTVKNPPSPDEVNVVIHLEFETVHCKADSGFPDTIAMPGGNTVILKCSGGKSGYKTRSCYLTDAKPVWSSVRDDCTSDAGTIAAIVVGVIAALIVIGCIVLFCVLRSGVFRKRAVSSVGGRGSRTQSMVEKANENAGSMKIFDIKHSWK